jgi:hypothetical protein
VDEKIPECSTEISAPKGHLLILGGAVADGSGISQAGRGWSDKLASAVAPTVVSKVILEDSSLNSWQQWLCDVSDGYMQEFEIILLSICVDDEGLCSCTTESEVEELMNAFCESLQLIVFLLRGKLEDGARLVLGGPSPINSTSDIHIRGLQQMRHAALSCEDVDGFVDFLQAAPREGQGCWAEGYSSSSGQPNDAGHDAMFHCISMTDLFGASEAK